MKMYISPLNATVSLTLFLCTGCLSTAAKSPVEPAKNKTKPVLAGKNGEVGRLFAGFQRRRDLEVLQLIHDAIQEIDGSNDKAQSMLAYALKLDPENKEIPEISQYLNLREERAYELIDERLQLAMRTPIPIDFEENRFEGVIDYFRSTTKLNFYINWSRLLNDAGIERDVPVNLRLRGVHFDDALDLILEQVSLLTGELTPIGWAIQNGILVVSTKTDLEKQKLEKRPLMVDLSWLDHISSLDEKKVLQLEKKTAQLLVELNRKRTQEVLELIQEAVRLQDSKDVSRYARAQSMLVYARRLAPDNVMISEMIRINQVRLNAAAKRLDVLAWKALAKPISVDFEENRFGSVMDYLQTQTGLNFYINWPVLAGSNGIERDVPINLRLRNIPVEKVLDLVLQQVNALSGEIHKSIWRVNEGIVIIEMPKPEPRHRKRIPR